MSINNNRTMEASTETPKTPVTTANDKKVKKKRKENAFWWDKNCDEINRERKKLNRELWKNPTPQVRNAYTKCKNKTKKELRKYKLEKLQKVEETQEDAVANSTVVASKTSQVSKKEFEDLKAEVDRIRKEMLLLKLSMS